MKILVPLLLGSLFFLLNHVSWNYGDASLRLTNPDLACADCEQKRRVTIDQGAIIRGDSTEKSIALVFTGDEYFEGLPSITRTLKQHNVKAGFFFTGNLYANKQAKHLITALADHGHYLGPHSDKHILYNDWSRRDSVLVTRDSLLSDIKANYKKMEALGIHHDRKFFIPPFEWWNNTTAQWLNDEGIHVVSFTWGIPTNADYTFPEMGARYRSSESILSALYEKEFSGHLKGAIILIHVGTDPKRKDKLYDHLGEIIQKLKAKGYAFERVDRHVE